MTQTLLACTLLAFVAAAALYFLLLRHRRHPVATRFDRAAQSRQLRQAVFADKPHEYRVLSPDKLPPLDHYFYDTTRDLLVAHGFLPLGDVENTSLTRLSPHLRTFTRALVTSDGAIVAGIRHMKSVRPATPAGRVPDDRYTIEFQTEFSDGSFLVTNNTSATPLTRTEPGITALLYPRSTPADELLRLHREALAARLAAATTPSLAPAPVRTVDDYIHLSQRLHTLVARTEQANDFRKPTPQQTAARQMLQKQQALYAAGDHEIRTGVSPADYPALDHAFYDRVRDALGACRFRFVHDQENLTVTRVFPHMRAYIRVLISADGSTLAGAYHIRNISPESRSFELETELSDGTFLVTSIARDTAPPVPGIDARHVPSTTSPEELVRLHGQRLDKRLSLSADLRPLTLQTSDDCVQFQHRLHALKTKHKLATGLITAEYLQKLRGRQLTPHEQSILAEVQKLQNPPADITP